MGAGEIEIANFILNAIQVGGLIAFLTLTVLAFVQGWVYSAKVVDELKLQIRELTAALKASGEGIDKMADAWEERNKQEADKARDDLLFERLKQRGNN